MFETIQKKFESLDSVFNQKAYDSAIDSDKISGFDPNSDKLDEKLKNSWLTSIPFAKLTGKETKYVLLEVTLESDGKKYSQILLRGFEQAIVSHPLIAEYFL
ncbi:MAG: hypothetical protein AABX39_00995, partial [Nanoarchaeota archaeon]